MEALKIKIFDVLTEKIAVSEFENWLYNSEDIINKMDNNSFIYHLVTFNYKDENWLKYFEDVLNENLINSEFLMLLVMSTCSKLYHSKSSTESFKILNKFIAHFDYETDSSIQYHLYNLYCDYDLYDVGIYSENQFNHTINYSSKDILEAFYKLETLEEKKSFLNRKMKVINDNKSIEKLENQTFKNKILAFLKKI